MATVAAGTRATLGGFPILGDGPVEWRFRTGTEPHIGEFDVPPDAATQLVATGRARTPVVLEIAIPGEPVQRIENLWVLGLAPGNEPYRVRVRVADRRWMWKYAHVLRRYNMHRINGYWRIDAVDTPELQRVESEIWYAAYSLNNGAPWEPADVLRDVLGVVFDVERNWAGTAPEIRFEPAFVDTEGRPVEQLEIDSAGNDAVRRALEHLPAADIYINRKGNVIVKSKTSGMDVAMFAIAGPEIDKGGHVQDVSFATEVPEYLDILFGMEVEVRFDFLEAASIQGASVVPITTERRARNVLPVPDYKITIGGESVVSGTWVPFDDYLAALPVPPGVGVPLDYQFLRRAFIPFMDLWAALLLTGQEDPNSDWPARVGAFQSHFRRTYQLPREWIDRCLTFKSERVATVNPTTGGRAPANAFAGYSILGGQRSFYKDLGNGGELVYAINVNGYSDPLGPDAKPVPADVVFVDPDQGVFTLNYLLDPNRVYEALLPSKIKIGTMPSGDLTARDRPLTFDEVIDGNQVPELEPSHQLAVIFTAIPAAPNSKAQLYRVRVRPDDIKDLLPAWSHTDLARAAGPPQEIRVGQAMEAARVRWLDSRKTDIEKIFGVGANDGEPANLEGLVMNDAQQESIGLSAASLPAIARAIAARKYGSMIGRPIGAKSGKLNTQIQPMGWIDEVIHSLAPDGVATTHLSVPDRAPELDWTSLLPPGTQAVLLRRAFKRN